MRYELKSIPIWPLTKVMFFLNLIGGFIFGFLYALFAGFIMTVMSQLPILQSENMDMGKMSMGILIVVMPFVFAFFSAFFNTIIGIVIAFLYNLITRLVGGIELQLQLVGEEQPSQFKPQPIIAQTAATSSVPPAPPFSGTPPPPKPPEEKNINDNSQNKDDSNLI
ncbi:MAG: hypothetical protein GXO93_08675 [FCB group bacterium]|nr:hypothetical protein [FCB group bacterium]